VNENCRVSAYSDLSRPPLREKDLERALVRDGALWRRVEVVEETGSTNADLAAAARAGAPEGTVLVAEAQSAGRGRLDRTWTAPPRSGLMFSVLLRPAAPVALQGWLPLLTGVAVASAVRRITARAHTGRFAALTDLGEHAQMGSRVVDAVLKWPNDVLVGDRKLAGILAERVEDAVVVGVGLNVSLTAAESPVPAATSLAMEDAATVDREPLLRAILRELESWYGGWSAVGGDPDVDPAGGYPGISGIPVSDSLDGGLRKAYKNLCASLGREVRVELPGDRAISGSACDIDSSGRIVIRTAEGDQALSAGDVVHLR
jgi:BirA family biotin operon repressor/biotin-[acetyl-CoA-carboxylase] ligase